MERFIKNKKLVVSIILVVVLLIAVTVGFISVRKSRKSEQEDSISYLIGVSQANLSEPWEISVNQELKKAASKYPEIRMIFANGAADTEKQISDIKKMMRFEIDLLIISPNDETALLDTVSEVYQSIPVIVLDKEIPEEQYTLFIGIDDFEIGQQAGEAVHDLLGGVGGNVLEIKGDEDSYQAQERSNGFREAILKYPNIEITREVAANWMRDVSEDTTKVALAQYPDIDIVFAHNDDMAYGAYIAAQKMRINNLMFVGVGGLEGVDGGLSLVSRGILDVTFSNTVVGGEPIGYAVDILDNGGRSLPKRIILPVIRIDAPK